MKTDLGSEELEDALKSFFLIQGEREDSRLFVWFAGHGHTIDGEGYLVPADAPRPEAGARFRFKALSMRRFGEWVREARSRHVLAVFDSCFAGTIFSASRNLPPAVVTRAATLPVRQFIASGEAEQEVSDDGLFRELFLRALDGDENADMNRDGYLTGSELGMYLTNQVANLTDAVQTPRYGKLRDKKYNRGDFVFLLAGGEPPPPSVPPSPPPTAAPSRPRLNVRSNVTGAKVYLDGAFVGNTNLEGREIVAGRHLVRVEMPGYEPREESFRADPGRTVSMSVDLFPRIRKGRVFANVAPENARIEFPGASGGFRQGIELDPGLYRISISAPGYETKEIRFDLAQGEDKRLDAVLQPSGGIPGPANTKRFRNDLGMEFVYIEPGTFTMGSPPDEPGRDDDEVAHRVTLTKGFYLQTTEVTQGQWEAVMGGNPSYFKKCGKKCPVEGVSWEDAQRFIEMLNDRDGRIQYRLPTEAEWEYAARAGTAGPFAFGKCLSTDQANFNGNFPIPGCPKGESRHTTVPVASFPANARGLHDMHGNVFEWCQDWYGVYAGNPETDPAGPEQGASRVLRGGSFDNFARYCRSANRSGFDPSDSHSKFGFRLAAPPSR